MADRDPLQDLHDLAGLVEHQVRPLPVAEVRARGTRRRRRRHAAIAGVAMVAALAAGGGVALSSGVGRTDGPPPIARSGPATAIPSTVRTISADNLPKPSDLPKPQGGGRIREYDTNARPIDQVSVCLPEGLGGLGATGVVSRSFKTIYDYGPGEQPDPKAPLVEDPTDYAVALQFPDPAAAERAMTTYQGWLDACRDGRGPDNDLRMIGGSFDWTPVAVPEGRAEVIEVVYRDKDSTSDDAYWESSGLTLVEDRLMITVHISYAIESTFTLDVADDEGGFPHPQLGLIAASAERLAR